MMTQKIEPFRVSNDALSNPEELRKRLLEEGYLFLRKFQNEKNLLELRQEMVEALNSKSDWFKKGTMLSEAIVDPKKACTEGDSSYTEIYQEIQKLENFHVAGHSPDVISLLSSILKDKVFVHPMKIARLWFPQFTQHTTPFHQDFVHFQSNLEVITVWTPVGDCPIELGPLAVAEGSHLVGKVVDHHHSLGAGGLKVNDPAGRGILRSNDFEVGDTLIFGCLMVHGALPNLTEDRLRISLDNRYQKQGLPVSEKQLTPHLCEEELTWDKVYKGWKGNEHLKFYWDNMEFEKLGTDSRFGEIAFKEVLDQADKGDADAIYSLEKLVTNATLAGNTSDERTKQALNKLQEIKAVGEN